MQATQAVGIDLGTTYSCIAVLNEHGEPISIPNPEGELSTPSVVFFDHGEEIVGVEALRNAVSRPDRVVQNAKRYMGDPRKKWTVGGRTYSPTDIASLILRQLLSNAENYLSTKIEQAVITVPAQFSDAQRAATVQAGKQAGLSKVDIINEPVAAALCYVLGTEGMWFTELANEQTILVYDLGGGTFDLSLVRYKADEVRVVTSTGDLHLGGIDFNQLLLDDVADQFARDFNSDPRDNPESLQYLSWEVEQTKRSLTVRPRATINVQHTGHRKSYHLDQTRFNELAAPLVKRTEDITQQMLKDRKLGWARVDVVLMTGGSSRMPMIRDMLKRISGRTINTSLSPDQSIAHGATYYSGMLLSQSEYVNSILSNEVSARLKKVKQKSVTARALGILIRDLRTNDRVPYYLIEPNSQLPAAATHVFGTVVDNQKRVHLQIVESGARPDLPYVKLGSCVIDNLPPDLKRDSEIAVTIRYDESARVHVSAKDVTSGNEVTTEIVRLENVVSTEVEESQDEIPVQAAPQPILPPVEKLVAKPQSAPATRAAESHPKPKSGPIQATLSSFELDLDSADIPVALCNKCGEALNTRGVCTVCGASASEPAKRPGATPAAAKPGATKPAPAKPNKVPLPKPVDDDEIIDLFHSGSEVPIAPQRSAPKPAPKMAPKPAAKSPQKPAPKPAPKPGSALPPRNPGVKPGTPPPRRPLGPPLDDD